MNLARERAHDLAAEIAPLLERHRAEVAPFDFPLAPNIAAYCAAEDAGILRCYTAHESGVLIGYRIMFVARNPHYASTQATTDVLYVDPRHRDRGRGIALMRYADAELAAEGVDVVYQNVPRARDFGPVLTRFLGYEPTETVYARRLNERYAYG